MNLSGSHRANRGTSQTKASDGQDLAHTFATFLDQQQLICRELEAIADSLPDSLNSQACLDTAQRLLPLIKRAHEFEENILFPLIVKKENPTPVQPAIAETIERLQFEHWGDEDFASDVYHGIRAYVAGRDRNSAESLGWMLRGFFESMRRHIAFEREFVLPLARQMSSK